MNPNYPRMMFHPRLDPVTVYSEEEEARLGAEWSRTIRPAPPPEQPAAPEPKEAHPTPTPEHKPASATHKPVTPPHKAAARKRSWET